jgi:cold shock CspA family protein
MSTSAATVVPSHLPIRATAKVKVWYDYRSFGFLFNPHADDTRDIFIHSKQLKCREGVGQRLLAGETVIATYRQDEKNRLVATKIEFPSTLNSQPSIT